MSLGRKGARGERRRVDTITTYIRQKYVVRELLSSAGEKSVYLTSETFPFSIRVVVCHLFRSWWPTLCKSLICQMFYRVSTVAITVFEGRRRHKSLQSLGTIRLLSLCPYSLWSFRHLHTLMDERGYPFFLWKVSDWPLNPLYSLQETLKSL